MDPAPTLRIQGHRRTIKVKKGDTIGGFLKAVRDQLGAQFKELRGVSVDNLMYIKVWEEG